MVFTVQLAVVFLLGMIYRSMSDPGFVISPMYLTAFFKSEFLHSLLPLEEWLKWIKNILFIIAISMEIADYGCRQKKAYAMMLIILLFLLGFIQEIGAYGRDSIMIAACLVSIVVNICRLRLMIDAGYYGGGSVYVMILESQELKYMACYEHSLDKNETQQAVFIEEPYQIHLP